MAAAWMVGLEDEPTRCGEVCIFEVFGDALGTEGGKPTAAVGMGVHPFRDPALADEFETPRLAIDVEQSHVYGSFRRALTLPADTDEGQIEAEIRDGLVESPCAEASAEASRSGSHSRTPPSEPSRRRLGRA